MILKRFPTSRSFASRLSRTTRCRPMLPAQPSMVRLFSRETPFSHRYFSSSPKSRYYDPNDPRLRNAKPLFTRPQIFRFIRSPSTHAVALLSIAAAVAFYFANMEVVPVSGRRRFNCFGEESVKEVARMQYNRVLYDVERSGGRFLGDWDSRTRMVKRVMAKLEAVSEMPGVEWEVRVIDDPHTANAFVLPGGKVFVYSGLFPLVRNEAGLAAVLGHEIAHNLADHVAERMSGAIGENIFLGSIFMLSFAIPGAFLVVSFLGNTALDLFFGRPMGRRQESEADYIGLMMMAEACYNPEEAVGFWRRMDKAQELQPPEFLSTHPSNQNRIQKIQEWLPKAIEKWQASDCHGTQGFAEQFRKALRQGVIMGE